MLIQLKAIPPINQMMIERLVGDDVSIFSWI
jgi:hypothetical protein